MQSVAPMEKTVSQSTFKHANPILDKKKLSPEEKRENCGILFQKRSVVSIKVSRAYLNAKHASTRRTNARKGIIIRVKKRKIGFWEKEKKDERSFPKRKITCNLSLWWKRSTHANVTQRDIERNYCPKRISFARKKIAELFSIKRDLICWPNKWASRHSNAERTERVPASIAKRSAACKNSEEKNEFQEGHSFFQSLRSN